MESTGEPKDPLALEAITERRMVAAFLHYLKDKSQKPGITSAAKESMEVARQCLSQAFDLTEERLEVLKTNVSLMDIFASHPDAVPADPKTVLEYELKRTPTASAEDKSRAEEFKNKGNDFMKNGQVDEALQAYTEAVILDPTNPILYCNRAAAFSKKNQHDLAAKDCEIAIAFDGNYAKAYGRYGLALHGLGLLKEAKDALDKAVSLDPENQLYKNNLKLVEDAINAASGANAGMPGGMPGGFPNIPGMPGMPGGMGGGGIFDMLQNQEFQQTMMQMMQNPQVQQMVGQFSNMFMNQMAGAGGAPGGAAPPGMPPGMPDMAELLRGGMPGMGNMTPEQIAEQMRGLFGGQQPPDSQPGSQPKPEDKDKNDKGPGSGAGGNPSYFS
ncbi:small glutamine-rich tetratricopeptide repeat-containing protein alpha-like [Paramacrobiotus metropolitanus]|uniref:small glutamine-rich tetratricopeptide repeat-containing protein alpha-like n=1 Tax=Paramacrobiotus metropolitanus TaxID=2943436 RepID=UPI0024459BBE|nr:small glutamine-rich tetratricopeptide repeat-containing protein alpha-like [Paramacrobiotus metropolitanus]